MPWTKEHKNLYMREWRKRHPGYNYAAVNGWRKRLREKLGEQGFLAWKRGLYRKYRDRILKGEKERIAKIDPAIRREKRKQYWATYKAKNGDRIKADRRDYYARNRERTLLRKRNCAKAKPESYRRYWGKNAALRRARKRSSTIGDLTEIAKIYERRDWWRQWFDVAVDHIVSLARGGTHEAKNLQIIYRFENQRKYTNSNYKPRVVFT